jgi:tRNA threonylcarbamoyladenosine biosynthesis protein TsaB
MLVFMPSLESLVAAHRAVLLIDSASACVQVGLWRLGSAAVWRQSDREAGVAIFECAHAVLTEAGIGLGGLGALVFCEGPGSILGIRTAAMALRTWQVVGGRPLPAFAYRSLELVARDLSGDISSASFAVTIDARRGTWHWIAAAPGQIPGPLERVPRSALAAFPGRLLIPVGFRSWAEPPRPFETVPYSLATLWYRQGATDLLRPTEQPDAFLHADPAYATWTPQIHRAPRSAAP